MNTKLLLIAGCIALAACTLEVTAPTSFNTLVKSTPELADCKVFELLSGNGSYIYVVRCPNSSVSATYPVGKITGHSVTIDEPATTDQSISVHQ